MDPQLLADLRAEQAALLAALEGIGEGWDRPTPAEGWTLRDTVAHLLVAERAATLSVSRGIDPMESGMRASDTQLPGDALLAAWRTATGEAADAFAAREDSDRVPWGGRRMSVRSLATARLMECWAHGLDCLAALNREATATPRLRHIAWLGYRTLPYAFGVAGVVPPRNPVDLRLELDGPGGRALDVRATGVGGAHHRPGPRLVPGGHSPEEARRPDAPGRTGRTRGARAAPCPSLLVITS